MFRQYHHGNQIKGQFTFHARHRTSELFNVVRQQTVRPFRHGDSEKATPARDEVAPVVGHGVVVLSSVFSVSRCHHSMGYVALHPSYAGYGQLNFEEFHKIYPSCRASLKVPHPI